MWPFTRKPIEQKDIGSSAFDMLWPTAQTVTGQVITPELALRQPTVLACTRIITETVGQLPLHTYTRGPDGSVERDTTSVFHRMFRQRPNDWTTAYDFKVHMQADVLLHGNAYALIMRDGQGNPRYLRKLPARAVHVQEDPRTDAPAYRVTLNEGGDKTYSFRDVIHLKALHGLSVVTQAREAISMALAQEKELNQALSTGQRPNGFIAFENPMTDDAISRAIKQFQQLGEKKGTAILDGGAKYSPISITNVDAQFLEQRRHQIAEIARAFRVPLHMLQELERVTHQNAEQLGRQFLQFTMLPWLTLWQQEIALKLMPEDGSVYVEFLTDDIARADLAARYQAFAQAVQNGILNPNEVRAMENRAPYTGGDEFLRPLNMEGATDA
ncbi:phage portal protein [uncultured Tateyamaria sp.]|uniref:phage portal protein n=1 Tax=uncultured Tateyamaria sp. TaxID=455651 RepID=UPI002602091D|nr:phage portal protein [uncultured Tateyamaria sp.]